MTRVLVLGANGRLGREVVRLLAARGLEVIAFVRRPVTEQLSGVRVFRGDALRADDLEAALRAGVDAVVGTISAGTLAETIVESTVARLLVPLLEKHGPRRLIAISAGMVVPTFFVMDRILKPTVFRHILAEHRRVEEVVATSDLDWTIVRPPRITRARTRGYAVCATGRPNDSWSVSAGDVAAFIGDELLEPRFLRCAVFLAARPRFAQG